MGFQRKVLLFSLVLAILAGALYAFLEWSPDPMLLPKDSYYGPRDIRRDKKLPKDDETIHKFSIEFKPEMITTLKKELFRTKWFEPVEDAAYHYGTNLKTFRDVVDYWRSKFDFSKAQNRINQFPHYKTEIEGLLIHFFRSPPETAKDVKVIPLLMIHGWPGSFVEFLKIAPMLNKAVDGVAFDIIVPSLPGYGYSDAPMKEGMDVPNAARVFTKLMARLGYSRYFVQGGDWGSAVATAMGIISPNQVRGIHLNMMIGDMGLKSIVKQVLFTYFPNYFGDGQLPPCMMVPFGDRFIDTLRETGYMHIQSTKPDTVGFALLNSPAGLAAYISEKFSTWTQSDYRFLEDGGLGKKLTLDDILLNIMVYYHSNSIISSQRFYRENMVTQATRKLFKLNVHVPTGYAVFPNELFCVPRFLASTTYKNITTMTYQKDGGHFAAFEQPELLEKDVRFFVNEVEKIYPETVRQPTGFAAHAEL